MSDGKLAVHVSGCLGIGSFRFVGSIEDAEVFKPAVPCDVGSPTPAALAHALGISSSTSPNVPAVLLVRRDAQIGKSVVGAVPVDVVDFDFWPLSVDVEPSKSMLKVSFTGEANLPVPVAYYRARAGTSHCFRTSRDPADEMSRRGIIGQELK